MRPEFKAPLYIAWEVTLRCNARCVHCYSDSGPEARHPGELSTPEALGVIDQLSEAGLLTLAFSGGEPLLRKDIFTLIDRAAAGDLSVNVATNGALIDEGLARRLRDSGVRSITVSLDGATAEMHERFRKVPGLFHRAVRAIETLVKHDLRVVVSFTPTRLNHEHGPEVARLAHDLGASAVNMSEYVPAGRGTLDLCLPPDDLRRVVECWIALRCEYQGRMRVIWHDCRVALLVPPEQRDRYSGCGAGRLTARIRVDGTLTPCVFLANPAGNLRETPFREIWEGSPLLKRIRDRDSIQGGNCGNCAHKHICGGCRAVSMACAGDAFGGDPFCWIVPDPNPPTSAPPVLNTVDHGP